jgi:DNA-binding transcriptional MerR regulator
MEQQFSIHSLAEAVAAWCDEHRIAPANGQAGEAVTERNIRYYRTIGLLDAPSAGAGQGFGEKHFLQLVAIRILQSQGVPLRRIRELLFGRSIRELREIQSRGIAEAKQRPRLHFHAGGADEIWRAIPLDGDFVLISRKGAALSSTQRAQILSILSNTNPAHMSAAQKTSKSKEKKP